MKISLALIVLALLAAPHPQRNKPPSIAPLPDCWPCPKKP